MNQEAREEFPGKRTSLAVAVSTAVASPYAAQAQERQVLEEVVVTATKREQSIQDIPMSVTAFSTQDIVKEGFRELDDYAGRIPGLSYARREPGGTSVIMRGCATSGVSFSNNSTTSVYLDEQPITDAGFNPDPRLIDIQRVEALSGPQGTLFGDASQCGTLRIITNKPTTEGVDGWVDASASTTSDGDNGYSLSGMANVPLAPGKLAVRLTGFYEDEGGFIDNILAPSPGGTFDNSAFVEEDVDSSTYQGGRAALRWTPNDTWTVDLQGIYQDTDTDGFTDRDFAERFLDNAPAIGELEQVRFNDEKWNDEWYQVSLTTEGKLGFADVMATASFMNRKVRYDADSTAYLQGFQQRYPAYNIYDFGDATALSFDERDTDRMAFEARASTPEDLDSRWSGIVGVFYSDTDDYELFAANVDGFSANCLDSQAYAAGCSGAFTYLSYLHYYYFGAFPEPNDNWFTGVYDDQIEQRAIFGEVNFDVTEDFTITAGGRWYDVDTFTLRRNGTNADLSTFRDVFNCGTDEQKANWQENGTPTEGLDTCYSDSSGDANESGFVPKLNATWNFGAASLAYFTYSEGFRRGGVNAARQGVFAEGGVFNTYESDELKNYEVGLKSTLAGGTLQFNLTAYHMVWEDIQLQGEDPGQFFSLGIVNLPEAELDGIEGAISWLPALGWDVTANIGYNSAELSEDVTSFGQSLDKGTRLPIVPDWKASVAAEYTFSQRIWDMSPFVLATWRYQGDSVNSLAGIGGTEFNNPTRNQDSYSLLNLRLGLENPHWSATFFVNNLTDESAELFFNDRWVQVRQSVNRPRSFGISFRRNFVGM